MLSERKLHEQVSIDADESEEENAGVEVGVKEVSVAYAEHISVYPVFIGIASHQHGEGAQKC